MILKFEIDTEKINDLQLKDMREAIERAKHVHFTDLAFRINGKYEYHEADWLKHFVEVKD